MPRKPMEYLSDEDLAYIAEHVERSPIELSRELGKPYFTVHKARERIIARGWACPLAWETCTECGRPVCGPARYPRRTAHVGCEGARNARLQRQYRTAGRAQKSTPYVAAWRRQNPERNAELRQQELARMRALWPALPPERQEELLDRAHEADQRDQALTAERANSSGERWTEEEDRYLLEHPKEPAREAALKLGRTLWAVRDRRVMHRKRRGRDPED